jgi:hypothetical protein
VIAVVPIPLNGGRIAVAVVWAALAEDVAVALMNDVAAVNVMVVPVTTVVIRVAAVVAAVVTAVVAVDVAGSTVIVVIVPNTLVVIVVATLAVDAVAKAADEAAPLPSIVHENIPDVYDPDAAFVVDAITDEEEKVGAATDVNTVVVPAKMVVSATVDEDLIAVAATLLDVDPAAGMKLPETLVELYGVEVAIAVAGTVANVVAAVNVIVVPDITVCIVAGGVDDVKIIVDPPITVVKIACVDATFGVVVVGGADCVAIAVMVMVVPDTTVVMVIAAAPDAKEIYVMLITMKEIYEMLK